MIEPNSYLHRAPFVAPVAADGRAPAVIVDGAVLTEQGRIVRVGKFAELQGAEAELVEHEKGILTPALVNCHAHLELSHLADLGKNGAPEAPGDITAWIRKLLAARVAAGVGEDQTFAAWQALARLYASGCRALADIGNLPESAELGRDFKLNIRFFQEFLGLSSELETDGLALLAEIGDDRLCTAHAPYSTSAELIRQLKKRATRLGQLFPIHVAESADEIEFLQTGSGRIRDFLVERHAWDGSFIPPGLGALEYLDTLGSLDEKTLCVHCVHVTDKELELIAAKRAKVCLCPGSNRFMGVGKAAVDRIMKYGIMPVLGTDSLASNPHFSLWQEMKILREDHPDLAPAAVFRMASRRGAEVLGVDHELGCLEPGRSANFLAVHAEVGGVDEVFDYLTSAGLDARMEWVE